ncbi:VEX1 protein, partial [Trogon melanurus]|nr:VEX1 protein [Trogon melanurus]
MEKRTFSVEWLAQSSHGGAQSAAAARSPPGDARVRQTPEDRGESRLTSRAAEPSGRPRTKFSSAQLQELERSFREQRYIGASEKRRLAATLNLSQSQIKTWFQNRRMKFKRQAQDAR